MSISPNNVFRPEIFVFVETALYFETAYLNAYFPTAKNARSKSIAEELIKFRYLFL